MPETLSMDDLLDLRSVGEVDLTFDGRRIAFVTRPSSYPKDGHADGRIWIGDPDSDPWQATRGPGNDALPRWAPDIRTLAFASDRNQRGLLSLHLLDFRGEARAVGDVAGSIEDIAWAADSSALVVLAADPGSDRAGGQSATKVEAADVERADPEVRRPRSTWRRLFRIDAATGQTEEVSPPGVNIWEFSWNGGSYAVAVVTPDPTESAWYDAEIAVLDLDSRQMRTVYTTEWQLQSPVLSSDGSRVAFIEGFGSDRTVLTGTIMVVELDNGSVTNLTPTLDVTKVRWLDDGRLAYVGLRGLESMCGRVALDGSIEELWRGAATLGTTHRIVASFSSDGRFVAAAKEAPGEPPEIAMLDTADRRWRNLTSFNQALTERPGTIVERCSWFAHDQLEIEGLLVLPDNHDRPLPLVVIVHGGPTNAWTFTFSPGYMHLGLLLANEGYAVLLPNPRGSTGRGQEFARANLGDMGGGDLADILAGVEALAEAGVIDPQRVGITGGSYGGFMSTWAPTQTKAFAASIPFACTSNWLSFHNTTNIGRFDELFLQSDPYDVGAGYFERSPVMHARNCTTPTLLLHGQLDLCTPIGQAQEFYQALADAGCETELVIYARAGHGWAETEYLLDSWKRVRDWYGRHLIGSHADGEREAQPVAAEA